MRGARALLRQAGSASVPHRAELPPASPSALPALEAVQSAKARARARFDEAFDVALTLGIDPRRTDQPVRGAARLPHGLGRRLRVAAFAEGEQAERARAAGADIIGGPSLATHIRDTGASAVDFERAVATPSMVPSLRQAAKVLGPRGLMPSLRAGTVAEDLASAVADAKAGQVNFRADRYGIVHARVGSCAFDADSLLANVLALMRALRDVRPPPNVPGGSGPLRSFFRAAHFSTTMGRGSVRADVSSLLRLL